MSQGRDAKIYVNGSLIGTHPDPHKLATDIREARRRGELDEMVNVAVRDRTDEVIVNADAGRARRPLIVVEDGEPLVTDEEIAVVRVTGGALPNQPGMVRGIVDPLADAHLSVHDVITSATSVAIFVDWSDRERALEIIQQEF